jgi:hypothetical protein
MAEATEPADNISSLSNKDLENVLGVLNPESRAEKRHLPARYTERKKTNTVTPPELYMDDYIHFHIDPTLYDTLIHIKLDTERGREIAQAYYLPPYLSHIQEWIDAQSAYVESLTARDKYVLRAYSYLGDSLVNVYLRKQTKSDGDRFQFILEMIEDKRIPFKYQIYDNYNKIVKLIRKWYSKNPLTPMKKRIDDLDEYFNAGGNNLGNKMNTTKLPSKQDLKSMEDDIYATFMKNYIDFFGDLDTLFLLAKTFFEDLMPLFIRAPRLPRNIVVYRGIKSEAHIDTFNYRSIDFQSTSLNPTIAYKFTKKYSDPRYVNEDTPKIFANIKRKLRFKEELTPAERHAALDYIYKIEKYGKMRCCVYEIEVDRSVPCIYIGNISSFEEYEVVLPPGINMKLGDTIDVRRVLFPLNDRGVPTPPSLDPSQKETIFRLYLEDTSMKIAENMRKRRYEAMGLPPDTVMKRSTLRELPIEQQNMVLEARYTNPSNSTTPVGRLHTIFENDYGDYFNRVPNNVAVIRAKATFPYYSPTTGKLPHPALVLNNEFRYAIPHKTRKGSRSNNSTKKEKAHRVREIHRAKTARKKERRGSTRRISNGNNFS